MSEISKLVEDSYRDGLHKGFHFGFIAGLVTAALLTVSASVAWLLS